MADLPRARLPEPGELLTGACKAFDIELIPSAALLADTDAMNAWQVAIDILEDKITDIVCLKFNADLLLDPSGILGLSVPVLFQMDFTTVRSQMISDGGTGESALLARLPNLAQYQNFAVVPPGFGVSDQLTLTSANCRALGLICDPPTDGDIRMRAVGPWDYDQSDGIDPGKKDFIGVVHQEMLHAMGFWTEDVPIPGLGCTSFIGDDPIVATTLALFDLAPGAGAADFTESGRLLAPNCVSGDHAFFDGVGDFRFAANDFGHWAPASQLGGFDTGVMAASISLPGIVHELTTIDLRAMDLIGWDIASTTSANCNANEWADVLDVALGNSTDTDDNGILDECEDGPPAATADIASRYIEIRPDVSWPDEAPDEGSVALFVVNLCDETEVGWVELIQVDYLDLARCATGTPNEFMICSPGPEPCGVGSSAADCIPKVVVNVGITQATCNDLEFRTPAEWLGAGDKLVVTGSIIAPNTDFKVRAVSGDCSNQGTSGWGTTAERTWVYSDASGDGQVTFFADLFKMFDNTAGSGFPFWAGPDEGYEVDTQGNDVPDQQTTFFADISAAFDATASGGCVGFWNGPPPTCCAMASECHPCETTCDMDGHCAP
ncbi:MAG: NF038122 family metalloprotease [Phycisphaerae bacterium]